jgi:peptidoglycan/xylan/chitin deacetylase (PgdA/CDA1 family)
MKKSSLLVPVLIILLSSCSTPEKKDLVVQNDESLVDESKFINKFRVPASVEEQPAIAKMASDDEEFLKILHSKDIEQFKFRLQIRLDAIEEVYLRAKEALAEFDDQLKVSSDTKEDTDKFFKKIIQSGVYSRLLALRENNLTRQWQMIYFFKKLKDIANDETKPAIETEFAKEAFAHVGTYFLTLPRQYLVAHYQIALELSEIQQDNPRFTAGIQRTLAMKRSSTDTLTDMFVHYQEKYDTLEVREKISRISKELSVTKTDLGDEVKKSAYMIQAGLVNDANLREPQSQKIEPSTGPAGNITGNTFPRGTWAITYDDGPHPTYTKQIANNLKEFDIKSTFFSLSQNVVQYPKISNAIKEMGMEIANHSHDHKQLTKLNDKQLDFEILSSTDKITNVIGEKPKYFRCPYGAGTNVSRVRQRIAKEDMVHVFWNVDSLDWQDRNPASIVARVKKQMAMAKNGGGVILFHDIHPQSVIASKEIMRYLKEGGANSGKPTKVNTIGEIVDTLNN